MPVTFELAKAPVPAGASAVGVAVASDRVGEIDLPWPFLRAQGFEGKPDQVRRPRGDGADTDRRRRGRGGRARRRRDAPRGREPVRAGRRRETSRAGCTRRGRDAAPPRAGAQAFADGASLALYRFDRYKTDRATATSSSECVWVGRAAARRSRDGARPRSRGGRAASHSPATWSTRPAAS